MMDKIDAGMAYHIQTLYDLTQETKRDQFMQEIDKEDMDVAMRCSPCTKFSSQQRSNETNKKEFPRKK